MKTLAKFHEIKNSRIARNRSQLGLRPRNTALDPLDREVETPRLAIILFSYHNFIAKL
jgi:hypothetical protein